MDNNDRETGFELDVQFDDKGLVPAIVQDVQSGQVLMMGWMNGQALEQTLRTGQVTFFSRSRNTIWVKGESSGHVQEVVDVRVDCDQDVILLRCQSHGPCCHAGYQSCFYRSIGPVGKLRFVEEKIFDPEQVYRKERPAGEGASRE